MGREGVRTHPCGMDVLRVCIFPSCRVASCRVALRCVTSRRVALRYVASRRVALRPQVFPSGATRG